MISSSTDARVLPWIVKLNATTCEGSSFLWYDQALHMLYTEYIREEYTPIPRQSLMSYQSLTDF